MKTNDINWQWPLLLLLLMNIIIIIIIMVLLRWYDQWNDYYWYCDQWTNGIGIDSIIIIVWQLCGNGIIINDRYYYWQILKMNDRIDVLAISEANGIIDQ